MSYRTFKRLIGETSLERKCRFLLGGGIVLLIAGSFWLYGAQTEHILLDQSRTTGRLLVPPIVAKLHVDEQRREALEAFQRDAERHWPQSLSEYKYKVIKPNARKPEHKADGEQVAILKNFLDKRDLSEEFREVRSRESVYFYGAVRAQPECLECHPTSDQERLEYGQLHEGDLMALVEVRLPNQAVNSGVHVNRALLISTAFVTALLIMAGSYLIVRYVIVKPVKHLKEVSDAITAGNLNVRSEIQTGDEFEDLSYAFNRMLRTLVSMQDGYRKLNDELDHKVRDLARANLALFESNQIKSDFLATMSHELRTPMHSILGFSDVLLSADGLNDKQQRWVGNIQSSGQQLLSLINDILDLAKIEAGRMEARPSEIDIRELCESQVAQVRPMAEKKQIRLTFSCPVHEGDKIMARQDPVKLRQIVSNLLSNALKFTPEGGLVRLDCREDGKEVVLTVSDNGIGIAPEDQQMIFEKFRQAENPMTREQSGSGLGLSIVRELTELLGGEIELESQLGHGSTFTVRLPARLPDGDALSEQPTARWSDQRFSPVVAGGDPRASANG